MRLIYSTLLAGAAALGLAAFAPPAAGKDPTVHQMTIQLPGGGSETIEYTGNIAPKVRDGCSNAVEQTSAFIEVLESRRAKSI
jgi:hypothetical protein